MTFDDDDDDDQKQHFNHDNDVNEGKNLMHSLCIFVNNTKTTTITNKFGDSDACTLLLLGRFYYTGHKNSISLHIIVDVVVVVVVVVSIEINVNNHPLLNHLQPAAFVALNNNRATVLGAAFKRR